MKMFETCKRRYPRVQFEIKEDKQSKPKYIVIPDASYFAIQSFEGMGSTIP